MTNNGGGPRWATMPRATCPRCGLHRPVGLTQGESGFECRNRGKCDERRAAKDRKRRDQKGQSSYRCRYCGKWHRSGAFSKLVNSLRRRKGG